MNEIISPEEARLLAKVAPVVGRCAVEEGKTTGDSDERVNELEKLEKELGEIEAAGEELAKAVENFNKLPGLLPCPFCGSAAKLFVSRDGICVRCVDEHYGCRTPVYRDDARKFALCANSTSSAPPNLGTADQADTDGYFWRRRLAGEDAIGYVVKIWNTRRDYVEF